MKTILVCVAAAGCWQSAEPLPPQPKPVAAPTLSFDDGAVCPSGSRHGVEVCLAAHGFCARDVTPLVPAARDVEIVITHGAVDCAGYYLLAAWGGRWAAIQEVHRYTHHDPRVGALAITDVFDETLAGHRITHLAYTIELVPSDDGTPPAPEVESRELKCYWPTAGFPTCE